MMRNLIALTVMLAFLGFVAWGMGWGLHAFASSVASTPTSMPVSTSTPMPTSTSTPMPTITSTFTSAPMPTSTPARAQEGSYIVQPGDTLTDIARAHSVSVVDLAKVNGLTDLNLIRVGQILTIP